VSGFRPWHIPCFLAGHSGEEIEEINPKKDVAPRAGAWIETR